MSRSEQRNQQPGPRVQRRQRRTHDRLARELDAYTIEDDTSSQTRPAQQTTAQLRNDLFRTKDELAESKEREANLKESLAQLQARFDVAETNYLRVRREKQLIEQTPNGDMMQHYLKLAEENEIYLKGYNSFDKELQDQKAILKAKDSIIAYSGKQMEKLKIRHNEKLKTRAKYALKSRRRVIKALKKQHAETYKARHRETATALATELRIRHQLYDAQDQIAELEKLLAEVVYAQQCGNWEMGALLAEQSLQHPIYRQYKPDAKYQPWLKPPPDPTSDEFYEQYAMFLKDGKNRRRENSLEQQANPRSRKKITKEGLLDLQSIPHTTSEVSADNAITLSDDNDNIVVEQSNVSSAACNEEKVKYYLPGTSETEYILIRLHSTSTDDKPIPLNQADVTRELCRGTVYNSVDDSVKYQGGRRVKNSDSEPMLRNAAEWRLAVMQVRERLVGELGVSQVGPDGQTVVRDAMAPEGLKRSARWAARLFQETARNIKG